MRFFPLHFTLIFGLNVYLTFVEANPLTKLAADEFIKKFNIHGAEYVSEGFINSHLEELTAELFKIFENEFEQVVMPSSFKEYQRTIKNVINDSGNRIKEFLSDSNEICNDIDDEWKLVTYDLLAIDSNYVLDDIDKFDINSIEHNFSRYEKYLNLGGAPLVRRLVKLLEKRNDIQSKIIEIVMILHKLIIEDEIIKAVYLFKLKNSSSDALAKKISRLSKLLNIYKSLYKFLLGDFDKSFKISILKLIPVFKNSGSDYLPDNLVVIYPFKTIIYKFNRLLLEQERSANDDGEGDHSTLKHRIHVDFDNNNDKIRFFNVSLDVFDDFLGDENYLEQKNYTFANPGNSTIITEGRIPVSAILNSNNGTDLRLVNEDNSRFFGVDGESAYNCKKERYFEANLNDITENNNFEGKSRDIAEKKKKAFDNFVNRKILSTANLFKKDNIATVSDLKCLSTQFICPVVRHLNAEEMSDLDRNLSIFNDGSPEKDKTLIWGISESLIDNYGGRARLLKLISLKIEDVRNSIERKNKTQLMNIGDGFDEEIGFYRKKQKKILSALMSLQFFLESESAVEVSARRESFIESFAPINKRETAKLSNERGHSYFDRSLSYSDIVYSQNKKHFNRLRNSFEVMESEVTHNHDYEFAYGNSFDFYTEKQSLDLPDLCTRFVAVVSITKSINSLCVNSYKFGQKVCSMIFEQPIHNLLSNQDYSWLTGIKLVETVNRFIEGKNLPRELFIDQKNALRALNYSFSHRIYNIHQACTQSLVSQKSIVIYRENISLHVIKPIFKLSCAEFFGISLFLYG
ncbi:hypothetical protein FG386_000389 [Cryptosporidium ryanae]|uniref:uncharacterized protein n=1 Tax=Cryptosporidium ryanae TaxID=515981 RepID=UPI00351A3E06|nr:hypothetical protein FG386_000389 [Cryptosporidium ryanae]